MHRNNVIDKRENEAYTPKKKNQRKKWAMGDAFLVMVSATSLKQTFEDQWPTHSTF